MRTIRHRSVRAIGEVMVELAPVGDGLYQRGFAGDTFNTVWHMAQLLNGEADVGFVTRLGADRTSDQLVSEMQADGMSIAGISRDMMRGMGLYLIELDGVERSFQYWRDTSAARHLADDPGILAQALLGVGLVHLSGITLAILPPAGRDVLFAALEILRKSGGVVSFDPNIRPRLWKDQQEMRQTISRMLLLTDIALPSLDDEKMHFGDASAAHTIDRMTLAGVQEVVIKDGPNAVHLLADGVIHHIPTPTIDGICDTTGAGDAFNAGYLAGRVLGIDTALCVSAGHRMAACVLGHFGARAAKPAIRALPKFQMPAPKG